MSAREWWLPEVQQGVFRAVLDGFSRPGTLVRVGGQYADAALMLLAALLDESVTLADTTGRLSADQRRQLLAPDAVPAQAHFVLLDGALAPSPDFHPALGTLESPERGATLVLTVDGLPQSAQDDSCALILHGPGIETERTIHVSGMHADWLARRADWIGAYPLGVDIVLCAADCLIALPRTTHLHLTKD